MEKNENPAQHYARIRTVLLVILGLNWAVALAKIVFGLVTRSSSMTADGFHSLADGASNILGLIGIHLAAQPKDKDHPYGHKKYDTLFALTIAALLFFVSYNLIQASIGRFRHPVIPEVTLMSFIIMLGTMGVNWLVMHYEYSAGKRMRSDILVSDSLHTKADLLTSFSVLVSLVVIKLGFPIIDPIISLLISLFIAYAGWDIFKHSSSVLCDTAAILDEKAITDIVLRVDGVLSCHNIRSRGREDDIYIDLHVLVDPRMQMDQAHRISDAIEEALQKGIAGVSDVVVHMEPKEQR